jgi:hypothetical protein
VGAISEERDVKKLASDNSPASAGSNGFGGGDAGRRRDAARNGARLALDVVAHALRHV